MRNWKDSSFYKLLLSSGVSAMYSNSNRLQKVVKFEKREEESSNCRRVKIHRLTKPKSKMLIDSVIRPTGP